MKAVIKPSHDTNRVRLSEVIPLSAPYTIFIEPTRYCNFKCFYCLHSTRGKGEESAEKKVGKLQHMDLPFFKRLLEQIMEFPERPKRLVFSGLGEPLMNPLLSKMIETARKSGAAERLDILTNASLLTPQISEALVEAGTSRIQVSLQGLDSAKYKEVCDAEVNFEKLRDNLRYLYEHKRGCQIFIKIIDSLVPTEKDRESFYALFGDVCDTIFVEHLITLQQQMGDHGGQADNTRNLNNEEFTPRQICPVLFYELQVDVYGDVFPCPVSGLPSSFAMGNVHKQSLVEIWRGKRRENLMVAHLKFNRRKIPVCSTCFTCAVIADDTEFLDDAAPELLKRLDREKV